MYVASADLEDAVGDVVTAIAVHDAKTSRVSGIVTIDGVPYSVLLRRAL